MKTLLTKVLDEYLKRVVVNLALISIDEDIRISELFLCAKEQEFWI